MTVVFYSHYRIDLTTRSEAEGGASESAPCPHIPTGHGRTAPGRARPHGTGLQRCPHIPTERALAWARPPP
eukprot:644726-Prymnesium_polylepis.1